MMIRLLSVKAPIWTGPNTVGLVMVRGFRISNWLKDSFVTQI